MMATKKSIGEREFLAVVWGLEKFCFYLYGKLVHLHTDHQALEPLNKRIRAYQQYSARLMRWLNRLAHFDIAIKHTAGKNSALTDYLSTHPTEEATTEGNHDEEYVFNILSKLCKLNRKYGLLLHIDRKFRPTDQSSNMALKAKRESTNEIALPEKFDSDVNPKDFTRKQAEAINSINTEFNLIDKSNIFNLQIRNWRSNSIMTTTIGEQTRK